MAPTACSAYDVEAKADSEGGSDSQQGREDHALGGGAGSDIDALFGIRLRQCLRVGLGSRGTDGGFH